MCRRCGLLGLVTAWAACLLTAPGCALHHCNFAPGEAVGVHESCDRHASHVYRRHDCCRPRRDPRIPGPHILSTLPAVPEMQGPSYFQPVPTYPVFGPRSEEPDGLEPAMQPLMPGDDADGETLPDPTMSDDVSQFDDDEDAADDADDDEEPASLQLAAPRQTTRQAGWKPARIQPAESAAVTRPCAKCTSTFKARSSTQR